MDSLFDWMKVMTGVKDNYKIVSPEGAGRTGWQDRFGAYTRIF